MPESTDESLFTFGRCPQCAEPYRLPAEAAGRRARCRACDARFSVPAERQGRDALAEPDPEALGRIARHADRKVGFAPAFGDAETINAIGDHIAEHVGPVHRVYHEIVSDLVHIDVHWVQADEERPFHTLITSGMSDRPMSAPPEADECRYAELMVRLPAEWRLSHDDFKDERWYWPVRWLKILARLPHELETWLWWGHSVPNGDPPAPFAPNTKLCGVVLLDSPSMSEEARTIVAGERRIRLLSMFPLYDEEITHKITHGAESLLARFDKHGVDEVVRIDRPNVCRRRFGVF